MELNKEYFTDEFKRAALPADMAAQMEPLLYTTMTQELTNLMDMIEDKGEALMSNMVKMLHQDRFIKHISRDGNMLSITLHETNTGDYEQREALAIICNFIGDKVMKWYGEDHAPEVLIPIYEAGLDHIPDSFIGWVEDMSMSYTTKYCNYCLSINQAAYENYCMPFKRHLTKIGKRIMKADKVMHYDEASTIIIMDKNTGKGPDHSRAHALACGITFAMFGIVNATIAQDAYKEGRCF